MTRFASLCLLPALFLAVGVPALGQDEGYKVSEKEVAAPDQLSPEIQQQLRPGAYVITLEDGKPFAEIWIRKETPARAKPAGPEGPVQFPFLAEGELLGAIRFAAEGHDYRDQSIEPGVYTIRFGLHPVNGDHLGVSTYRDYGLLLPSDKDQTVVPPARKALEKASASAAGTNHPAVLILRQVKSGTQAGSVHHDAEKNLWGVVLPFGLKVADGGDSAACSIEAVFSGMAAQ